MAEEGYNERDISRKYVRNDLAGRRALTEGEPVEMKEIPAWWYECPNAAFVFSSESEEEVRERVIKPMEDAARDCGIEYWFTGDIHPIHATAQAGDIKDRSDTAEWKRARELFEESSELHESARIFAGMKIPFKYLIVNGSIITLTCTEIPPEVKMFREQASALLEKNGFKALSMENTLHISVARIKSLPNEDRTGQLRRFRDLMIKLRHEISRKPLELQIDHMFVGGNVQGKTREEL